MSKFEVVRTQFHSRQQNEGHPSAASTSPLDIISRHRSRATAERAVKILTKTTDCTCGCYVVVEINA